MIETVKQKILAGERVSSEDALALFREDDIHALGELAASVAERKNGKRVYFIQNRHINPTNICVNRCRFCAFSRSKGEEGAFELSIDDVLRKMDLAPEGLREVHIVGGLHPDRPFAYYLNLLESLKKHFPHVHIKAFTAVEVDYLSRISRLSLRDTLLTLKDRGLDAMPGGGAEIFAGSIREKLCPEKITGERWLEVHKTAHSCGIKTNATMLYGHFESYADRIEHLVRLRELQDETGGFQAFIPLSYHPRNTDMGGQYPSGIDDLKTTAISRIVLDNFDHIKAYWIMLGEKLSQVALLFGADDIDGTVIEEKITHAAGAMTGEGLAKEQMINIIRKAGKVPVERDAFYKAVKVHE